MAKEDADVAIRPPYSRPIESRRPYGSHRFEVHSLKAQRRLTLFGVAALRCWLRIEADPATLQLCERPVLLPERSKPVDFWSQGLKHSTFTVLCSDGLAAEAAEGDEPYPAFNAWANSVGCEVDYVGVGTVAGSPLWYANWTGLLQHLARYQGSVTEELEQRVAEALVNLGTLGEIVGAVHDVEAARVRAAVFSLVHKGRAVLTDVELARLSDLSTVATS